MPDELPPTELPPAPPDALAAAEDERAVQQMVEYLRQHGSLYETEALRQQLLKAGQRPDLVEQAISRAEVSGPVPKERAWPLGLLVALGNLILMIILFSAVATSPSDPLATFAAALPVLMLVGELVAGVVLLNSPRRRLAKALLWGVLFSIVIPIILILLVVGICLVILAGASGSLFR